MFFTWVLSVQESTYPVLFDGMSLTPFTTNGRSARCCGHAGKASVRESIVHSLLGLCAGSLHTGCVFKCSLGMGGGPGLSEGQAGDSHWVMFLFFYMAHV